MNQQEINHEKLRELFEVIVENKFKVLQENVSHLFGLIEKNDNDRITWEQSRRKEQPNLSDYFAMSIANAVMENALKNNAFENHSWEIAAGAVAKVCYKFADACEIEREKILKN